VSGSGADDRWSAQTTCGRSWSLPAGGAPTAARSRSRTGHPGQTAHPCPGIRLAGGSGRWATGSAGSTVAATRARISCGRAFGATPGLASDALAQPTTAVTSRYRRRMTNAQRSRRPHRDDQPRRTPACPPAPPPAIRQRTSAGRGGLRLEATVMQISPPTEPPSPWQRSRSVMP